MLSTIFAKFISFLGNGFVDRVLTHLERKADNVTERQRIAALRESQANTTASKVVMEGMQHKVFWIPWLIAAIPTATWFAWGMVDSIANGALPDVAALPPQLKAYADVVFSNIFYAGGGVAGIQMLSAALRRR